MYSIKRLILLVVVVSWLVGQPALAASKEPTDGTARQASQAASILRVDDDSVAVSPNGSSWANAYPKLQDALAVATSGDEIWVAAGIYYPDEGSGQTNNARTSTFQLKTGVAIYGGFAGMETTREERDWETNVTVLSGDIDGNDTDDDNDGIISSTNDMVGSNAYHVVTGSGTDSSALLDGVTINAGKADDGSTSSPNNRGGGIYNDAGSPTLTNVTITANSATTGGGMVNYNSSNITFTNVTITSNSASSCGGGMYNYSSTPTLTNVTITANSATTGGGMCNYSSTPTLTNVTITANSAHVGGGMYDSSSDPALTNVTIASNSASFGGGMSIRYSSNPILTNVTITANSASYRGGGMHNDYSSNPTLTNVTITANSASRDGGGMFNDDSSNPTLTNVTITANFAESGGGMYNEASSNPVLTNVTITANSASRDGGGMYNDDSSNTVLTNVILWNNQANSSTGSTSASIYNGDDSTATISYSLIANSGGSGAWESALGTDSGNNIADDPKFVTEGDPSTLTDGDYRLQLTSPAIDAGNNSAIGGGITTDLAGNSRFADVTSQADTGNGSSPVIDMGAYEVGSSDMQSNLSEGESYDLNNSSLQIDTLGNLDTIAVYHVEQSYPDAPEGIQTGHYWQVNVVDSTGSEASGFSLSVTLPHTLTTPSDARICRYTGSTWDCGDNSNTNADATTVTRTGMSAFSPIAVGNAALPLAVNLASFTADASLDEIRLEWVTVSELENLGFNIYRAEVTSTSEVPVTWDEQLNSELILSQAPGSGQGATYEWLDTNVEANTTYYYWLEDVDIHGATSLHGPISATLSNPTAVSLQDLGAHESGSAMWMLLVGGLMLGLVLRRFFE